MMGKIVLLSANKAQARDEKSCWDIGGGTVEFNYSLEDTLRREIKEEYGTNVITYELLGYRDIFRENDSIKTHWFAVDFKVLIDSTIVNNTEPHKFDGVDFFSLDTISSPVHSQLPTTNCILTCSDPYLQAISGALSCRENEIWGLSPLFHYLTVRIIIMGCCCIRVL